MACLRSKKDTLNSIPPDRALYERYLQDQCGPEEADRLLAHVQAHGIDPAFTDLMDRLWAKLPASAFPPSPKADRLFARISERAGLPEPSVSFTPAPGPKKRLTAWQWSIVLLLAGLAGYWFAVLRK